MNWCQISLGCVAALLLSSCPTYGAPKNNVKLDVYGPPTEASETGQAHLYKIFKIPVGEEDGGRSSQKWSMLGREDKGAQSGDAEYAAMPCPANPNYKAGLNNVIAAIAERAAFHRIIIINESHTVTRHRETVRQLLPKLRAQGYTVFAAETFSNSVVGKTAIAEHADLAWVHRTDGYYSNEPVFGRLIRRAKSLGFKLAAYEDIHDPNDVKTYTVDEDIARRENGQARNLASLLKTMAQNEKLIVYAGYSHAKEVPDVTRSGKETTWMAARLKAITGLDPLTVSQTGCRSKGGVSFLAKTPDGPRANFYDLIISHPQETFINYRPNWRRNGSDIEVRIPLALKPVHHPFVIEAFLHGEPFDAVPMDRIYVEPGEDVPLLLPPGRYLVRAVKLKND